MSVNKYFDNDEEEQEEKLETIVRIKLRSMNKIDFSGRKFNEWFIIAVIDQRANVYQVVCSCGREFTRDVYPIVNYLINQCRFCYKKKSYFNAL